MASANPVEPRAGYRRQQGVSVIAHRGFGGRYPENTVAAMERSTRASTGADAVEVDVYPTADGDVVVFHDETPRRLTDAPDAYADRPIWEIPTDVLADLEVLGTGHCVPTFAEVLAAVPADVPVNVEFKNPGTADVRFGEFLDDREREAARARWSSFARTVLDVARETGHDLLVSSFCEGALAAVRAVDPAVPTAAVVWDSVADGLAVADRYDCEAIHVPRTAVPGTSFYGDPYPVAGDFESVDVLRAAARDGRAVHAWTVTDWRQAAELRTAGVDAIIADHPGLFEFVPPE